jgi:hypothetical protein
MEAWEARQIVACSSVASGITYAALGVVRNFLLIMLLAAGGYWFAHQNHGQQYASDLAGAWSQDFIRESTPGTMVLSLEADGGASLRLDYVQQGLRTTREVSGHWTCSHNQFAFSFSPGNAPAFLEAKRFGGRIVNIDAQRFEFKSPTGIESWSRVH